MVHIKSAELCERCAYGVERCMEKWDEDGRQCDGCEMNRGKTEHGCICDEIAEGIPCEFFKERSDEKG